MSLGERHSAALRRTPPTLQPPNYQGTQNDISPLDAHSSLARPSLAAHSTFAPPAVYIPPNVPLAPHPLGVCRLACVREPVEKRCRDQRDPSLERDHHSRR